MRKLMLASLILGALLPVSSARAGHFTCPMSGHQQPGVGGLFIGVDAVGSGWKGVCVQLRGGGGGAIATASVKFWAEGTRVQFGICTEEEGDCPPVLAYTGVRQLGGPVSCGIGACFGGTEIDIANGSDPQGDGEPTLKLARRTGVNFEPGGGHSTEEDPVVCYVIDCLDEQQVDVGTFNIFVDSEDPVLSIPLCLQAGNFATDCATIT